jgi:hypothetical protein
MADDPRGNCLPVGQVHDEGDRATTGKDNVFDPIARSDQYGITPENDFP